MKEKFAKISVAVLAAVLVLLIIGCSPSGQTPESIEVTRVVEVVETRVVEVEGETQIIEVTRIVEAPAEEAAEAPAEEEAATGGKTLTIGMSQEPRGWGVLVSQIARIQVEQSMNAKIVYRAADLSVQPWLTEKIPSEADGDLVVNDDGIMEATWTLREGITWHDGTPLTVEDVIFGWEVMVDPDVPAFGKDIAQLVDRIEKVDERTFTIFWSAPSIYFDQGWYEHSIPLPVHILGDVFESDKEAFNTHPYWTTEFIGTGPYEMAEWVPGSHIELVANEDYFIGRPNIDRVVWRFITDSNTLMANLITGDVEVVVNPGLSIDQGLIVQEAFNNTGSGTVEFIPGFGWDWIVFDMAEDPKFADNRVRQALLYSIDRQAMVDALFAGNNPVAHGPIPPRHPLYTDEVAAAHKQYEYNPEMAAQLFAEAGWTPGSDGTLVNAAGEPFTVSIRTVIGQKDKENAQAIIADYWREAGVQVEIDNLPTAEVYDNAHLFQFGWPSAFLFNFGGNPNSYPDSYTCDHIPSEANSFSTANLGQYCNEEFDAIYNASPIDQVLDPEEREALAIELMQIWTEDVGFLPLYYKAEVVAYRTGITGVAATGTNEGWVYNIHEWDKE